MPQLLLLQQLPHHYCSRITLPHTAGAAIIAAPTQRVLLLLTPEPGYSLLPIRCHSCQCWCWSFRARLAALGATLWHWQMCYSLCKRIFAKVPHVLFLSLRHLLSSDSHFLPQGFSLTFENNLHYRWMSTEGILMNSNIWEWIKLKHLHMSQIFF